MRKFYLLVLFALPGFTANAQIKPSDISLVKSYQSSAGKAKPAIASFTIPDQKDNSYLINAAIGLDISSLFLDRDSKLISISPHVEYNRNTLIDKEQNLFISGLAFDWVIPGERKFTPRIIASQKYSHNYEKQIQSLQGDILLAPKWIGFNTDFKNFWVPDNFVKAGENGTFGFEYVPSFGLEFDHRYKATADSLVGNIYRFVAKLETNIYLFPKFDPDGKYLYYNCQLSVDYNYRNEFANSSSDPLPGNDYLTVSLDYVLFKNDDVDTRIGIDYVNGSNPNQGFEKQNYYCLSFKIKM